MGSWVRKKTISYRMLRIAHASKIAPLRYNQRELTEICHLCGGEMVTYIRRGGGKKKDESDSHISERKLFLPSFTRLLSN